jgi:drug/metabolite transporter (DMT)-like permease
MSVMGFGEALSLGCAVSWAFVLILFRHTGKSVHPFALNLFKNIIAFGLFIPTILLWHGPHLPRIEAADAGRLLLSGFLGLGVADTLVFTSLNVLGAGVMAIVECLYSPFVILFSLMWLGETLSRIQAIGCALVVIAVFIASVTINVQGVPKRDIRRGIVVGMTAIIMIAAGVVIAKPALSGTPLLWAIETRYLGGLVGVLALRPFLKGKVGEAVPKLAPNEWLTLFASSTVAYLQMMMWLGGMKFAQASIAAVLNQTATIFTIVLAALILHEPLTRVRFGAATLAMAGVFLITR